MGPPLHNGGVNMFFGGARELNEKLDRVIRGQEEIKALLEELRSHGMGDKLQEGIDNILSYAGPKGGAE